MAVKTWLGGSSAVVSTGANWSGGTEPANADDCYWNSVTTYPMGSGTFTNTPATITVTEGAGSNTGADFGAVASPITLTAVTTCRFANRGNVYVTSSGTVTNASFEMSNIGTAFLSGGTWTNTTWVTCRASIGASAVLTNVFSLGATGDVAISGTAITLFKGTGRWAITSRNVTTGKVKTGGTLVMLGTSASTTEIEIERGGVFAHQSSGTVAAAEIHPGGLYTVKGNPNTTGTAAILSAVTIWTGGLLVEAVEGFALTVTAKTYRGPQSVGAPPQ